MMIPPESIAIIPPRPAPWRHLVGTVFSFEMAFGLFLFAGRIKADPRLGWLPIDLTVLLYVLSVLAALPVLSRLPSRSFARARGLLIIWSLFAAYALLSLLWSPSSQYGPTKAFRLSTLSLWSIMGTSLIISGERMRFRRFVSILLCFSIWLAGESVVAFVHGGGKSFIQVLGGGYLGLGQVIGMGAVMLYPRIVDREAKWSVRLTSLAGFGVLLGLQLVIGGRGSFLATIMATIMPSALSFRLTRKGIIATRFGRGALLLSAGVLALSAVLVLGTTDLLTLRRFRLLLTSDLGASATTRLEHYSAAAELWADRPVFGHGIGAYPILRGLPDEKTHPHNIVLEILVELGVVGFILFCLLIFAAFMTIGDLHRLQHDELLLISAMLVVNVALFAFVSDDISENRILLSVVGLLVVTSEGE